jgi:hypothetical protein
LTCVESYVLRIEINQGERFLYDFYVPAVLCFDVLLMGSMLMMYPVYLSSEEG